MKDYEAIVFAGHLGLTERARMVADAFNASAENAKDYLDFKQAQDDRASIAMTKAITLGQSRLSQQMMEINDLIGHSGGALTEGEVAAEQKKLAALKMLGVVEKFDVERLKPELDSLSQLFNILGMAEAKMNGFDAETQRHTQDAKGYLMQYHGEMTDAETGFHMQEKTVSDLEGLLRAIETDNKVKAEKTAFGDYLKSGPAVAAPMPAPSTAKFRKKTP